ncbi:MAG: OprO/OprP family phosphate-selective porin, partial [Planctomycetia bacterium]
MNTPLAGVVKKVGDRAGVDNRGFYIAGKDDEFKLWLIGQVDAEGFFYTPDSPIDVDTLQVRRARFGAEGALFDIYQFRIYPDFGRDDARLLDAFVNVRYEPWLQFQAGKFRQPFSYEQQIRLRHLPTPERSLIDQLTPGRDVGLMAWGVNLFGDRMDYGIAVANGDNRVDRDTDDGKEVNARIGFRPLVAVPGLEAVDGFTIGASGSYGRMDERSAPAALRTPLNVRWLEYESDVRADGQRLRWTPEIAFFNGPFGIAAQYFHQQQDFKPDANSATTAVDFEGFYVMSSYILTGESRKTYAELIEPIHPFDWKKGGRGAWEAVGRVSRLHLDDSVYTAGVVDPEKWSNGCTEMTVGLVWHLTAFVRCQLFYERSWFDEPLGDG